MQTKREVAITTPLGDDVLLFHRMTATEELGRLFQWDLELLSRDPDIPFEKMLGENVTVRLTLPDNKTRFFNGYVSAFCQEGTAGDYIAYRATVQPWLWFLTRTADCRIFQNQTVPDIIKKVFRDHGFTDFEEDLSNTYRQWEYCVQYRETDFNFVSRLLEQEGIYYYFKHEKNKHTLVLADSVSAHERIPGYEKVPYYPPDKHGHRERDHIYDWSFEKNVQPGVYAVNDYDFTKPKANIQAKSAIPRSHAQADMEIYDFPGEYAESKEGEFYARARIEELQVEHEQIRAQGNARGITAGGLFALENFPRKDQNREHLVISASHEIASNQYQSGTTASDDLYDCRFSAISSETPFRPARATPKPMVQGPQTAEVVGKPGEEIWTDKYGRIKIQFYWDRYGKHDQNSSCWVRVSHPTAGKGWGSVQIPRIGQEVIVNFLEGDPDRPIITGRVYNANQMPPYDLPGSGMVSGMKSKSTPGGGGFNEMSMNDTKGEETITIHGQHDMTTTVENDRTNTVVGGNDTLGVQAGTRAVTVKGNTSLTVEAGDRTVDVTGNYKLDTTSEINMQAPSKMTLTCGGSNITIEPGKITISAGDGAGITLDANASTKSAAGSEVLLDANADMKSSAGSHVLVDDNALMESTAGDKVQLDGKATLSSSSEATVTAAGSTTKADVSGVAVTGTKISLN